MKSVKISLKRFISKYFSFMDNSNSRDTWVIKKLKEIPKGKKILDAGAGENKYKKYCKHLEYKSQDFNKYDGKGDSIGLQTDTWDVGGIDIVSDVTSIPVDDNSFDYILCTEVLEHIPYPDMAIKEFSRILKKGGGLILTAPFCSQTHFAPYHFCTGFNIYWYREVLKHYGLEVQEFERNGNYFDFVLLELVRTPIMLKKYSPMNIFPIFLYFFILPLVLLIWLISKITKKSEEQMCFGYHILAEKLK